MPTHHELSHLEFDSYDTVVETRGAPGLRIDRDIGHIELGVVDFNTLTVVSASERFYSWIGYPKNQRIALLDLIQGVTISDVHQALEAFDGVCELEAKFKAHGSYDLVLRMRLIKTGSSAASPLRLLAYDISELRRKEEVLRTVSNLLESHKALIADSRRSLKLLLDSLPQAVFLVDSSLRIISEVSKEAEKIFGSDIESMPLSDLLKVSEGELEPLALAFSGLKWELMVGIMPKELKLGERSFSLAFMPIYEDERHLACVSVVITDITERKFMERSLERSEVDNRALLAILTSKEEFVDLYNLALTARSYTNDLSAFRSIVHGLKGGFSFLECDFFVSICHTIEDELTEARYTARKGYRFIEELLSELASFIQRHQHVLHLEFGGSNSLVSERLRIDYRAFGDLFNRVEDCASKPELLRAIERLVELPARRLFSWLNKAWLKTLDDIGKEGVPITWGGDDDITLAREPYKELFQSFLHIIRNAADHGIELPKERLRRGKSRAGSMHIDMSFRDGSYRISFEDDGAGIDPEALMIAAKARGIEVPSSITPQAALMLICEPGFSSRSEVTEISGRGIGVDAVRRAARLCGGDVSVESVLGRGTKITVWFKRQRYW